MGQFGNTSGWILIPFTNTWFAETLFSKHML